MTHWLLGIRDVYRSLRKKVQVVESSPWTVTGFFDSRFYPTVASIRISVVEITHTPLYWGKPCGPPHRVYRTTTALKFTDGYTVTRVLHCVYAKEHAIENARLDALRATIGYTPRASAPISAYRGRA